MTDDLDWRLVLDAHQITLIDTWQQRLETGDGPAVLVQALGGRRDLGRLALPLDRLTGAWLMNALAMSGEWAADIGGNALLALWHDGQLHGALGHGCPWPGRLAVLRVVPTAECADYYPTTITGVGPAQIVDWRAGESVRDNAPALPVPMLDLLHAYRHPSHLPGRRLRLRRGLGRLGVEVDRAADRAARLCLQ